MFCSSQDHLGTGMCDLDHPILAGAENTDNTSSRELLDRSTMVVNSCFSTMVVDYVNNPDPKTMVECKQRSDWIKWKEANEAEHDSLRKREVFSNVIPTPPRTYPIGFKWVFI
jgi:hypothetical protein